MQHLENQLQRDQTGSCERLDLKQQKKEERKLSRKLAVEKSLRESKTDVEGVEDENTGDSVEEEDDSEMLGEKREAGKSKKKIDVTSL